eukprot:g637.t1
MAPTPALVLDVGSSSVRCSFFPDVSQPRSAYTARQPVRISGEGTFDALDLLGAAERCVAECVESVRPAPAVKAVAFDCFAMSLLGVDATGEPVTPVFTYADRHQGTAAQVRRLRADLAKTGQVEELHQRTGAPLHTSYAAGQLCRLAAEDAATMARVAKWQTFSSFCLARWTGKPFLPISYSEASWTGLMNVANLTWDDLMLDHLPAVARS